MPFFNLTKPEKEIWLSQLWLSQHVPHRICAALALLKMRGMWAMPKSPILPHGDFHVWCIGRSIDEGRKAAMRWLIEFVGITLKIEKNGSEKVVPPKPHMNGKSVTIREVGGVCLTRTVRTRSS